MQLPELLMMSSYAGPPVIGAFIGYVTNRIAIKMLFRPLRPWHIAGLKVPMTPGVIPSKRHELADNIGEMVGEHLLTGREVGTAISREPFQEHLNNLVDRQLRTIVDSEHGAVTTLVPEQFRPAFEKTVEVIYQRLSGRVHGFLSTQAGEDWLDSLFTNFAGQLSNQPVNEILSLRSRESVYSYLGIMVNALLKRRETREEIAGFLKHYLIASGEQGKQLRDLVPHQAVEAILVLIEDQAPALMRHLGTRLSEPAIRSQVIAGVLKGVDRFIDSLGPVGAMARGFIDMDSLEKTIDSYLTEKEEDIINWLQQPSIISEVHSALKRQLDTLLDKPLHEVVEGVGEDAFTSLCNGLADQVCSLVAGGDGPGAASLFQACFESWLEDGHGSFHTLLGGIDGAGDRQTEVKEQLKGDVLNFIRSEKGYNFLYTIIKNSGKALLGHSIGSLAGVITEDTVGGIREIISLKINKIILKEVPGVVKSLQINRLVTEKVNSLDLLKLEGLLLSIMEEQFKYINLFGALLGFIIGCVNLLLLRIV